jgi:carboxyl-terminal processing protease
MKEENESKRQSVYRIVMLVVLTAFITFMITSLSLYTYFTNNSEYVIGEESTTTDTSSLVTSLNRIKSIIEKNYLWIDEVDEEELEEAAIAGYVDGLGDQYTAYISKEDMQAFTEDITGSFVGIGIYMVADEESDSIIVYYPIPDSPAEEAGIKAGDIIKSVDGVEYGYDDFDTIADHIKGEAGTKVKLVIERDGKDIEFEITRAKIATNPITIKVLEDNIGYLKIPSFDTGTADDFKEKVEELQKQGCTSLIIDLRNNGGGIVDESTDIADLLLEKGKTIMTTKDNNGDEEVTESKNDATFDMPIVILANENTASASEILIGALKDNERATVIGTTTYGKGVIQTVISLSDGSGLKITTAEYFTPNGTAIHGIGIVPDTEVELPDTVTSIYSVSRENDTQLNKAIEVLKQSK